MSQRADYIEWATARFDEARKLAWEAAITPDDRDLTNYLLGQVSAYRATINMLKGVEE